MTDYYRDRVRQGGILSNQFVQFVGSSPAVFILAQPAHLAALPQWFNNQVGPMQYGNAEKSIRRWGELSWLGPAP